MMEEKPFDGKDWKRFVIDGKRSVYGVSLLYDRKARSSFQAGQSRFQICFSRHFEVS